MYQFSLRYFTQLFNLTIENSPQSKDLTKRLVILLAETTSAVYTNVSRGLFEKDKLVFSFMLCAEILKLNQKITNKEWIFLLRGVPISDKKRPPKPDRNWLTDTSWNNACDLTANLEHFKSLTDDIVHKPISVKLGKYLFFMD